MNERVVLAYQAVIDENAARIIALEVAATGVLNASIDRIERELATTGDGRCWACTWWPRIDGHAADCPVATLMRVVADEVDA
jgi:hypothetical protein